MVSRGQRPLLEALLAVDLIVVRASPMSFVTDIIHQPGPFMARRTVMGPPIRFFVSRPPVLQVVRSRRVIARRDRVDRRPPCGMNGLDREGQTGNPRRSRQGHRSASL